MGAMVGTAKRWAAAIAATFSVGAAGCVPDLDREEGELYLTVTGIPEGADQVRIRLSTEASDQVYDRTVDPRRSADPTRVRIEIESFPAGPALARVTATALGEVLRQLERAVSIPRDGSARAELALPEESEFTAAVEASRPAAQGTWSQGTLELRLDVGSSLASALARARTRLGGDPSGLRLDAATVTLTELEPGEDDDLRDLWRGILSLTLAGGGDPIGAASGTLPEDTTTMSLTPSGADLAPLLDAAGAALAVLSGTAKDESGGNDADGTIRLELTVTFSR